MFCKYCGNNVPDGAVFCPSCGSSMKDDVWSATVTPEPEFKAEPVLTEVEIEARESQKRTILTLGICSVAFACTGILALVGLILACICRSKIRAYELRFGPTSGIASVGKGLSLGGLIGSIVMTAFFTLYFAILILAIVMTISEGGSYYDSVEFAANILNYLRWFA